MSEEKPFAIEYAKSGRSACKHCKKKIGSGELRVAKLLKNPFRSDPETSEKMRYWHHLDCIIEVFKKQRAKTKRIDDPEQDVDGWSTISDEDKEVLVAALKKLNATKAESAPKKRTPKRKMKSKKESDDNDNDAGGDDESDEEPEPEPKISKKRDTKKKMNSKKESEESDDNDNDAGGDDESDEEPEPEPKISKKRDTKKKMNSKKESEESDDNDNDAGGEDERKEESEPEPEPKVLKKKATSNGGNDADQPPEKKRGRGRPPKK